MHLGRFHRAIELLAIDYRNIKHTDLIKAVINSLNAAAANPGNVDTAKAFKSQLNACREALAESPLNRTRPILTSMLESINARQFIGNVLAERIIQAVSQTQGASALAVQELTKLNQEVTEFYQHVVSIDVSFSKLGVEYDDLDDGEAEVGLLVPRDANASTLKDLSKEFNEWHIALTQLANLFDKDAGALQIRTCSTTDWMIYLATTPPVLKGVSVCIKGINQILRDLIESRQLIEKLIAKNGNNQHTEGLLQSNDEAFDKEIRAMAENLVDENAGALDDGIKNQMKNGVNIALKQIASKINTGAKIELRYIPPPKPELEEAEAVEGGTQADTAILAELEKYDGLVELSHQIENDVELLNLDVASTSIQGLLEQHTTEE